MHSCNTGNRWVQVKNVKAVTENYYIIMFFFYVVTMVVYVFNSRGDICVQWRQVCAVETVIATLRMFNM